MSPTRVLSTRVEPTLADRVKSRADAAGISTGDYIREAIEWALERDVEPVDETVAVLAEQRPVPRDIVDAERRFRRRGTPRIETGKAPQRFAPPT